MRWMLIEKRRLKMGIDVVVLGSVAFVQRRQES
jgi:hypothetical protein